MAKMGKMPHVKRNFYYIIGCMLWAVLQGTSRAQALVFEHGQMGTLFRIQIIADDSARAAAAAKAAFNLLDSLNLIMSDYRSDSELNRLSATAGSGQRVVVSPALWEVLQLSQAISRLTDGAFDVSIGALTQLWRRAVRQKELPDPQRLKAALSATGYRYIRLYPKERKVKLTRKGMKLDLGGIAKGYANAQMQQVLRQYGFRKTLIEGGGDLLAGDAPDGTNGWRVLVGSDTVSLQRAALATSGDDFRFVEIGGHRYSHVINPRTGMGVTHRTRVSVMCADAALADALSSAFSVMGEAKSSRYAPRLQRKYDFAFVWHLR
ncbi:FAD:protein FMN transferase [Rhodoflexus caldus]|uniref:FAD:protein FMN transferase n=1 Tax=Rhodoflexus caldus TaxID=2891236 RepID=UPI002029C3A0|nr:FAD:protein FMN transferase [Rhodoflexus caldus]